MNSRISGYIIFCMVLATLLFSLSVAHAGRAPWHWLITLRGDASGKSMDMPYSLYVDPQNNRYYISDAYNNRLLSFSKKGKFLHSFSANGRLKLPLGMLHEPNGILWVVERGNNSLARINLKTHKIHLFHLSYKGIPLFLGRLHQYNGKLYILDKMTGNIYALDQDLHILKVFKYTGNGTGFIDFKVMRGGLWALEQETRTVYRFGLNGKLIEKIHLSKQMDFPYSLAVGPAGMIYIADRHKNCIFVFDGTGEFVYKFLSLGQDRGKVYYPAEIDFDPWGRLCVVEEGNGRVEVFGR